eukprot:5472211-Amphidinium_carterae.1
MTVTLSQVLENWRIEAVNPDKYPALPKYPDETEPQIIEEAASSAGPALSPRPLSRQALVEKLVGNTMKTWITCL